MMKRDRFLELSKISVEVMELLDKRKVTRNERCTVNRICNNINEATYDQDVVPHQLTEAACIPDQPMAC